MKKTALSFLVVAAICMSACTGNNRAKNWGGTETIDLPAHQKLVTITWKDNSIWYLTRPMEANETPITSTFQEKSAKGFVEGTVIIKETK